jgi:uncharacterized protein YfiM (DUF2279 family)
MTPGEPAAQPSRKRFRWTLLLRLVALAFLVTAFLAIDGAPLVGEPAPPDAGSIDLARGIVRQVAGHDSVAGAREVILLGPRELDGFSALASQVIAPIRAEARLVAPKGRSAVPPELALRLSRSLPLGAWLNIEARAHSIGTGRSLPVVRARIGHLPVPAWLMRLLIRQAWSIVQPDRPDPPTLEDTFPEIRIGPKTARVVLINPGRNAALAGLAQLGGTASDPRWVARAYCALTPHADADLAQIVRRAWRLEPPAQLGLAAQDRGRLAGSALPLVSACIPPDQAVTLAGRGDLAKHWALSAALQASLGGQVAQSLGAFKELSDSLEGGTGFSFVDLAADRSGERFARAATDPQLARFVQTRLAAVTADQLFAREALTRPEGLDATLFERTYSTIDSPEYAAALAAVEQLLDNIGVPKP